MNTPRAASIYNCTFLKAGGAAGCFEVVAPSRVGPERTLRQEDSNRAYSGCWCERARFTEAEHRRL
jgi:hypothetical protein